MSSLYPHLPLATTPKCGVHATPECGVLQHIPTEPVEINADHVAGMAIQSSYSSRQFAVRSVKIQGSNSPEKSSG